MKVFASMTLLLCLSSARMSAVPPSVSSLLRYETESNET
jgi:hypothetical protein